MIRQLTILFTPMDGVGHVNACIGLAECLRDRGHKIVFAIDEVWSGKLVKYGFEEEILENKETEGTKPGEEGAKMILETGFLSGISSFEKIKIVSQGAFFAFLRGKMMEQESQLKAIIVKQRPDVYVIDNFVGSPSLMFSDKPWVSLISGNPLFVIDDERTPPAFSGYSAYGDKSNWAEFKAIFKSSFTDLSIKNNKWLQENGYPSIGNKLIPESPYLNIYGYPEELDYTDIRPLPDKWFRTDAFCRKGEEKFEIPEKLIENNGNKYKIIYLSLGSMGSVDVELMKRLVNILSKTEHKFIVSKGVRGDSYELGGNMWGQNSVPQTKVLPLVDLVITHGGNNTFTETFTFGKPMIVMPLFADQYDNAQRVEEKGFGIRLNPYNCTEEELLNSIEKLLNDNKLRERLAVASKRMLNSNSLSKASELIEKLVQ